MTEPTITVALRITNVYELAETITTTATAEVPAPPTDGSRWEWAEDHRSR